MAYILKKSAGGGGGGTATDTNQTIQIDQVKETSGMPSVFKKTVDDLSVFLNSTGSKSITDLTEDTNGILKEIYTLTGAGFFCAGFTSTTLGGLATLIQNYLNTTPSNYIVSITFSSAGSTQHDALVVTR